MDRQLGLLFDSSLRSIESLAENVRTPKLEWNFMDRIRTEDEETGTPLLVLCLLPCLFP